MAALGAGDDGPADGAMLGDGAAFDVDDAHVDRIIRAMLLEDFGILNAKQFQVDGVRLLAVEHKSILVVHPAGSGKSAIFGGVAAFLRGVVFVIEPLLSIAAEQTMKALSRGALAPAKFIDVINSERAAIFSICENAQLKDCHKLVLQLLAAKIIDFDLIFSARNPTPKSAVYFKWMINKVLPAAALGARTRGATHAAPKLAFAHADNAHWAGIQVA